MRVDPAESMSKVRKRSQATSVRFALPVLLRLLLGLDAHFLELRVEVCLHAQVSRCNKNNGWAEDTHSTKELHEVEERDPHLRGQELLREDGVHRGGHPCDLQRG